MAASGLMILCKKKQTLFVKICFFTNRFFDFPFLCARIHLELKNEKSLKKWTFQISLRDNKVLVFNRYTESVHMSKYEFFRVLD